MTLREENVPLLYLKPGEILVAATPHLVSTLLGSCVAITFFSSRHRFGTICHALLPLCRTKHPGDCPERFRHVVCSIHAMMAACREHGIPLSAIEAKVFGGADMFFFGKGDGRATVGRQNCEKALELLAAEGVRVVAVDMGGGVGRKVYFSTHTGEVYLKRLGKAGRGEKERYAGARGGGRP